MLLSITDYFLFKKAKHFLYFIWPWNLFLKKEESRKIQKFNILWTRKYFNSELYGKYICFIDIDKISICRENKNKTHYTLKHESYYQTYNEEVEKQNKGK